VPAIYDYCEAEGIGYTIGLISNPRLEGLAATLLERAVGEFESRDSPDGKARLLSEGSYEAGSWDDERRVVYKAEVQLEGTNTRFVVTSRTDEPEKLYDWYVMRGEAEGWIKDFKRAMKADRLSCHRFWANQFRLLLHAAAYWPLGHFAWVACECWCRANAARYFTAAAPKDRRQGASATHQGVHSSCLRASRTATMACAWTTTFGLPVNNSG
jgi:hypothetical protein